jgi:hypothetical protein
VRPQTLRARFDLTRRLRAVARWSGVTRTALVAERPEGKENTMGQAEVAQLITDLQQAVASNPEAAKAKVAQLKSEVQTLPPEQRQQVAGRIEELRHKAMSLPQDQQQQLADIVSTLRN